MIQLSTFTFLALLEVLMAMALLLAFMVWQKRKRRRTSHTETVGVSTEPSSGPTPSLYLESEAAKTKTFAEFLHGKPREEPTDLALRAALELRAGWLRKESDLAYKPVSERDATQWTALAELIRAELSTDAFTHASVKMHAVHGEDTASSEVITALQTRTIQHLRAYVEQLLAKIDHQPSPDENIVNRFDEIERANREMGMCISVLEDENSFLRDQIAALLKDA